MQNLFMKNKNLYIGSRELMHKSIVYVSHMSTNTGQLLVYYDFIETCHILLNFVDFYGMNHSIPRDWVRGNERRPKKLTMFITNTKKHNKNTTKTR